MIQAPTTEKDSLSIQEVKSFLNFWLLAITGAKLFNPYPAVPYTSTKKDTGLTLQVLWHDQFCRNEKGRES